MDYTWLHVQLHSRHTAQDQEPFLKNQVLQQAAVQKFLQNRAGPDGLKLYCNEKKCHEKEIEIKTRRQLACHIINEYHTSLGKKTIWLWDSWFTYHEMVSKCKAYGYSWIGEIKSNRIVFYEGKSYNTDRLICAESGFFDVAMKSEVYHAFKANVFMPKMCYLSIVMNVKADTKMFIFSALICWSQC